MRILHTADWHLGTRVPHIGLDRSEEQDKVVKKIIEIVEKENIDVVIIAGDIFDNPTPSYQAEKIFYNFIASICGDLGKYLFVISGNHDSMEKVDTVSVFSRFFSVRGSQRFKHFYLGIQIENGLSNLVCDVDGISFIGIPFVPRYRYSKRYQEIFENILGQLLERTGSEVILFSHDTLEGVKYSETEIKYDDKVLKLFSIQKLAYFNKVRYWALGHIHKYQEIVKDKICYSGGIVQIDFGEAGQEKGVVIVSLESEGVKTKFLKIDQVREFRKFDACDRNCVEELLEKYKEGTQDFVKIVLKNEVGTSLVEELKNRITNLVLVKETHTIHSHTNVKQYEDMIGDPIETFKAYCKDNKKDLKEDEIEELRKIYDEIKSRGFYSTNPSI
ncbi:MAG: exonuclease SbcCD subunit D [Spirochaetia bacterium]|nr:exonuclease SbcCD subunit D [Spirochaetota bacterium]MCX8096944.1 exonuclease SbcCD subunit D [Spirochaetota bacterium]MDW8112415.1 exonuclease SbcCD subunit D [Spirochaetia bacterium]